MAAPRRGQVSALISILGEDKITSILADVEKQVKGVGDKTDDVGKRTKRYTAAVASAKQGWSSMLMGVNSGLQIFDRVAASARQVVATLEEAGKSIAIEQRFKQLFESATGFRKELQVASSMQIDDTSLEQFAAKAKVAGLQTKDTIRLIELATKTANATGKANMEVADAFLSSYVKGSDRALKLYGINADMAIEVDKYAKSVGRSTVEITAAEKQAIFMQAAVKGISDEFGDVNIDGTLLDRARKFQTEIANWEDAFGRQKATFMEWAMSGWLDMPQQQVHKLSESYDAAAGQVKALTRLMAAEAVGIGAVSFKLKERVELTKQEVEFSNRSLDTKKDAATLLDVIAKRMKTDTHFREAILGQLENEGELLKIVNDLTDDAGSKIRATNKARELFNTLAKEANREADEQIRRAKEQQRIEVWNKKTTVERIVSLRTELAAITELAGEDFAVAAQKEALLTRIAGLEAKHAAERAGYREEGIAALLKELDANDAATEKAFSHQLALADVAMEYGKNEQAVLIYRKALKSLPPAFAGTATHARVLAGANNELNKSLLETLKLDIALQQSVVEARRAAGEDVIVEEGLLDRARSELDALESVIARTTKTKKRARGGKASEAKWFKKLQEPASEMLTRLSEDAKIADGQIRGLTGTVEDLLGLEQWEGPFDPKGYEKVVQAREDRIKLFQSRGQMFESQYQERIKDLREKYNKEIAGDQFKKSAKIRSQLKDGLALELAELEAKFGQEKRMRDQALADEMQRFDAAVERAKMVKASADGFRRSIDALNASSFQSFSAASSFASEGAGRFARGFADAVPVVAQQVAAFQAEMGKMGDANNKVTEAFKKGGPAMLSASGKVVAGFIDDERHKAAFLGGMEAAASIAAFAIFGGAGVQSGIMHGLASAMYFAIAGKGKKGGGGRSSSSSKKPQYISQPPGAQVGGGGVNQITLNVSGTIVGNDEAAGRQLADMIKKEMRWSGAK